MILYIRLSFEDREKIYLLWKKGENIIQIAKKLNRHRSTISRELSRCKQDLAGYNHEIAHQKAQKLKPRRWDKLAKNPELRKRILNNLQKRMSPEQISGRLKLEKLDRISHETIYKFIYSSFGRHHKLCNFLTRKRVKRSLKYGRKAQKTSKIKHLVPISERPEHIGKREELGHFEVDLVLFSNQESANITTMVERKSRFILLSLNINKTTKIVIGNIKNMLETLPKNSVKSMTFDRGTEFASHYELNILTFFCNPHSPWQKGAIENLNGRLRRFLPKGFDYRQINAKLLAKLQDLMNNTPRKCLDYMTPAEVFYGNLNL